MKRRGLCLGLLIILAVGCSMLPTSATPTPPIPPDQFEESVEDFCQGKVDAVAWAKPYDETGDYHPILWINSTYGLLDGKKIDYATNNTDFLYDEEDELWIPPSSVFDYELVACSSIVSEKEAIMYSCSYSNGVDITAMDTTYKFVVYRLDTGNVVGSFRLDSQERLTRSCSQTTTLTEDMISHGWLSSSAVQQALEEFVFSSVP